MFNVKKKIGSILLSLIIFLSSVLSVNFIQTETAYATASINYSGTYYNDLGGLSKLLSISYTGDQVKEGLSALIGYSNSGSFSSSASDEYIAAFGKTIYGTDNKHPKYSGTASGSLAYLWQTSERSTNDSNSTGSFRLFYSDIYGTSLTDYSNATVNREHVWPQSLSGGMFGTTGAGADIHHVRPANGKLNNARGNKAFADLTSSQITLTYYTNGTSASNYNTVSKYVSESQLLSSYSGILTGYASSSYFEPIDSYKGDIARIFAYLIVHYPSLESLLDNVLVGGTDTLIEWNELDPVDSYEIQRNNSAYSYQGNRNPFIDAPELIEKIWG